MTLASRIAPHLPYLRRFSRATTGSQTSGDAYVAATLEALIADTSIFPEGSDDRVSLYKLSRPCFLQAPCAYPTPVQLCLGNARARNLSSLAPKERQAFLLVAVEGFSRDAAADPQRCPAEFDELLSKASRDISAQVATDIMIIEDEPLIAMDIEQMVQSLGHNVTAIARTHKEAVALYNKTQPKMILADIQLADGSSGIDAVNDILTTHSVPVIFITAFPERLLTGERPEPTFLVTKPFNPEMVKALISQALFFDEGSRAAA